MFRWRATDGPSFFSNKYQQIEGKKFLGVRVPKGGKSRVDNRYQKNRPGFFLPGRQLPFLTLRPPSTLALKMWNALGFALFLSLFFVICASILILFPSRHRPPKQPRNSLYQGFSNISF